MIAGMADEVTTIGLTAQFEKARPWKDKHPCPIRFRLDQLAATLNA
jgi:hypothetical protein